MSHKGVKSKMLSKKDIPIVKNSSLHGLPFLLPFINNLSFELRVSIKLSALITSFGSVCISA